MIACLSVPYFATAVEKRESSLNPKSESNPGLVLGGQPWEPRPVYGYSREVAHLGVKPGMSLRLAHILSPEAQFMAAEPPKYLGASAEITDILTDFTHLLEPEELWLYPSSGNQRDTQIPSAWSRAFGRTLPARFTVDLESLPSAEAQSLVKEMGTVVRQHTKLSPSVGLAKNPFAAHVAATLTQPDHARMIEPGEESNFLSSQTIHFLPLEKEAARRLSLLGIRTLGQLAALPKSTLYAQFGSDFTSIYQMAQGYVGGSVIDLRAPLQPISQEKRERVVHNFEEPISNLLILERVISRLASQMAGRLQAANMEVRTIRLSIEVESTPGLPLLKKRLRPTPLDGLNAQLKAPGIFTTVLTRRFPTSALQRLEESFKELLHKAWDQRDQRDNLQGHPGDPGGVMALVVELKELSPAVSLQQLLFSRLSQANGQIGAPDGPIQTEKVVKSVAARHGSEYFYRPTLTNRNHPLPERRFQMTEYLPG